MTHPHQNNTWLVELAEKYPSSADPRFMEAVLKEVASVESRAREEEKASNRIVIANLLNEIADAMGAYDHQTYDSANRTLLSINNIIKKKAEEALSNKEHHE